LDKIWQQFHPSGNPVICTLFNSGPAKLSEKSEEFGYKTMPAYAGKCHLCTQVRKFLFDLGKEKSTVGPQECYIDPALEKPT